MDYQEKKKIERTSRGQLAETEDIVSDLVAAVDHVFDIPFDERNYIDDSIISNIRDARFHVMETIQKDVNMKYHCLYKHLLASRKKLTELYQAKLLKLNDEDKFSFKDAFICIDKALHFTRSKYFEIDLDELDNPDCPRCLEDKIISDLKG